MELQQQIQTFIELTNEYEQLFSQLTFGEESNFEENNHLELRSLLHLVVELQEDVIEFRLKKLLRWKIHIYRVSILKKFANEPPNANLRSSN